MKADSWKEGNMAMESLDTAMEMSMKGTITTTSEKIKIAVFILPEVPPIEVASRAIFSTGEALLLDPMVTTMKASSLKEKSMVGGS